MSTVSLNINRLNHLLKLFSVSREELLHKLNANRKQTFAFEDIFAEEIKLSILKKIDSIFKKGLSYYVDPKDLTESKEESIFFRKDTFNAKLNLGARQIVNRFEEEKISFTTLAKLSDFKLKREIPVYKLFDNPKAVAFEIRKSLYPEFIRDKRTFLKNFIAKLADYNILVFEFVETHNKIEKANINGFYLTPNVIVLKRNQKSLKREIFTLAHELGHYLLNEEEIDENVNGEVLSNDLNKIEKWCNDFAYYFLAGRYSEKIDQFSNVNNSNDYYHDEIDIISDNTHLSSLAIYTRLLLSNQITPFNYRIISENIFESIRIWEEREKTRIEQEKQKALEEGRKPGGQTPRPIVSPLYLQTLKSALVTGLINEADFCKKLSIKPDKMVNYL
jgi:Zn-dependent peptidase ImmA (M78 family)